jgi:hypothetical protein
MLKIDFKIKPKTQSSVEEDDAFKIINAMRLIDQNISRGTPSVNKLKRNFKLFFLFFRKLKT